MQPANPRRVFLRNGLILSSALGSATFAEAQRSSPSADVKDEPSPLDLPNATQLHLKQDYEQNVKDAHELAMLAHSIETEIERNGQNVLSTGLLKKLDDVDKISRRMSARMKH